MSKFKIISTLLLLGISVLVGAISGNDENEAVSYSYGNTINAAVTENKTFLIDDTKPELVVSLDEVMEENRDKTFELRKGMKLQAGNVAISVENVEGSEKAVCVKLDEGRLVLFDGGKATLNITGPMDMEFSDMFILGPELEETAIYFNGENVK